MATIFKMAALYEIFRYQSSFIGLLALKMLHVMLHSLLLEFMVITTFEMVYQWRAFGSHLATNLLTCKTIWRFP